MVEILQHLQETDYSNYCCSFLFVLSHGSQEGVITTDGRCIPYDVIQSYFTASKCPSLSGKPKVFIFQLCRNDSRNVYDPRCLENDMLIAFASQPLNTAYRYPDEGSPYIQSLVSIIEENVADDEDFISMLTMVAEQVINYYKIQQAPDFRSRLLYKLSLLT